MNDKNREDATQQQDVTEANENGASPDTTTGGTLSERDSWIVVREKSVLNREEGARLREDGSRLREEGASLREDAASLREDAVELEEQALQRRLTTEAQLREANENLVIATIRTQSMIEAAEQATDQMAHLAEHDFLTGLPNRVLLTNRLEQAITLAERHGKKVALIFLDLDHFKHINDSLGHEVGDLLLQSVATRLHACVRISDTVSRHGGDEFLVLLPELDEVHGAVLIAQKLIEAMTEPHLIGGHSLSISLSIGISLYPDDGMDVEAMIRNADTAMYHAKKSGRNNYQVFTPDMNLRVVWRQAVERGLNQALEQSKFVLHYQPKVNLETGAITGVEAFLRWQRTDYRLVRPTQFMDIAENSGLIMQIGKWVLREACRQAKAWLEPGIDFGQIAVNVSAKEFLGKNFLSDVRNILDNIGLEPHHLEIELTESELMHDSHHTIATLCALKKLGVRIAIDDFGTGYFCLSNLWSYPIDTLKIDQSFVQDIDSDAGKAIISAIIAMGTSFKQRVIAEGIETGQQLDLLKSLHCAEGQGYYFGRPVAAEEVTKLLIHNGS